ncbi:MAG: hypothetical protein ABR521_10075 [Gaiellaceae bacterium]
MKRICVLLGGLVAVAFVAIGLARAGHSADPHSANMALVGNYKPSAPDPPYAGGTDTSFWGNLAIAGNLSPGGFRILDISNPTAPTLVSNFICRGSQSDITVWDDLVFVSIDGPRASPDCDALAGSAWEGIRVVSIADPANPVQIATVRTDCGSHTHTLVPDLANDRLLLYVLSYPLGDATATCSPQTHRKISVVEVPLANPAAASVIGTPSVGPAAIGCHDVTVLLEKKIAGAACISESQVWDISNPEQPVILAHINNPAINIHHSTTFSWDGNTLVIGDELGGAAVAPGCVFSTPNSPAGALWFYDVSDRTLPLVAGPPYHISYSDPGTVCSAHNFNTLPTRSDRDILASSWYSGATTVVDFTNPAAPTEIGYYVPKTDTAANSWSTYWYRDYMYANNRNARGVDVFRLDDAAILADAVDVPHLNQSTMEPLPPPTAVTLRSLRSAATAKGVVVRWRTGSETALAGFNVYRVRANGSLAKLNRTLIRAHSSGKTRGHAYAFTARGGRAGTTYRLEAVGLDGTKTRLGTTTAH